ncbi:helix-turn-helix domain-containing protein [Modestobacter sp. VKM Ac-2984]|uniref:helix-turn-helix domain-containing protein n=1 Tax=Modestobacter sp. VKM Ac-2984 TaxID=3004138 RepID=UPI0022AADB23|nr:helix-turn-helix domain-containing protein [Modestobacter sp. VKM Ac-2984]MCZ2818027.1 helix-turn-helix domain-containing protein [Modestobacter sp. VKM Ac-2984]
MDHLRRLRDPAGPARRGPGRAAPWGQARPGCPRGRRRQLRSLRVTSLGDAQRGAPRYRRLVPYPPRPEAGVRPELRGSASPRPDPLLQQRVEAYIVERYQAGASLRVLAEETDRSFSAIRNILDRRGIRRRGTGAPRLTDETDAGSQLN